MSDLVRVITDIEQARRTVLARRSWDEVEVSPTASPISLMLGGYPRVVTDARMTSRIER